MRVFLSYIILLGFGSIVFGDNPNFEIPLTAAQGLKTKIFPLESSLQFQSEIQLQHPEKKSLSKAFFYSLLLPGLGEAYVGYTDYTKIFLTTEILGWGLLIRNLLQVQWHTEDYENYAIQHAGINKLGKDAQYWIDIGKYDNIYEYNEQRRRDRNVDAIYVEGGRYYWQCDNRDNRLFYDLKRIKTREMEQMEIYYIGGIVLNHLVSAINALRLARIYNKKLRELSWKFNAGYNRHTGFITLSISKSF